MNLPCIIFCDLKHKKTQFVFLIIVFIFSKIGISQISEKSSLAGSRFSGLHMSLYHESERKSYYELRFEPYYMFFIKENWGVGIMGEMEFSGGNLEDMEYPEDIYGIGPITRFYYPLKIDKNFFRRMKFYSEASLTFTNYYQTKETFVYASSRNWKYSILRLRPLGMSFKLFKGFNLELSPAIYKYFPGRWRVGMNFGFEYHFNKGKDE